VPTPDGRTRPARRGYLLLLALGLGALLVFNLQPIVDMTRRTIDVVAVVPDAPGVIVGTEVLVEGVKVGRVREVALATENDSILVVLRLRMERGARALVTPSSDVRASRRRFIAEPVVRVFAGAPGDRSIQPGDTIRGQPRLGPDELLAQFGAMGPTMDTILDTARRLQVQLEQRQPAFERLIGQIEATTATAAALSARAEAGSLGPMLDPERGLPAHVRTLRGRLAALSAATHDLGHRYSADGALMTEFRGLAERAQAVDAALADLEERMEEGGGFAWRIQADTALQLAVRGVQLQIDSLRAEALSIALRMFLP
jgi:hypothetical protein